MTTTNLSRSSWGESMGSVDLSRSRSGAAPTNLSRSSRGAASTLPSGVFPLTVESEEWILPLRSEPLLLPSHPHASSLSHPPASSLSTSLPGFSSSPDDDHLPQQPPSPDTTSVAVCPAWWGESRRADLCQEYGFDEALCLSDIITAIEPPLRAYSFLLHCTPWWVSLVDLGEQAENSRCRLYFSEENDDEWIHRAIETITDQIQANTSDHKTRVLEGETSSSGDLTTMKDGLEVLVFAPEAPDVVATAIAGFHKEGIPAVEITWTDFESELRECEHSISAQSPRVILPNRSEDSFAAYDSLDEGGISGDDFRARGSYGCRTMARDITGARKGKRGARSQSLMARRPYSLAIACAALICALFAGVFVPLKHAHHNQRTNTEEQENTQVDARGAGSEKAAAEGLGGAGAEGSSSGGENNAENQAAQDDGQPRLSNGVVEIAVPTGWSEHEKSSPEKLIVHTDGDPRIRILVAAHPVKEGVRHEDLVQQVETMISSRESFARFEAETPWREQAVTYEETPSGGSMVRWVTFLQDNQQISVGCQWMGELTPERSHACSLAARTARAV